ncbi:hypothetical protein DPX16_13856 [Anabarilius grahami]|uniref:Uncharacterized protein n=1 Tax=Anabarilius grahami TaxID=495550 RepID=A0A3N0XV77_ANAGA|nr:hypothetical protein DPX16_13856 [Anabarilius grahami]
MDITQLLLWSSQGTRSLEEYVQEYLDIAYLSDLPDCALIDFFCDGVNQPLQNQLRREGPRSSLGSFMDYALLSVGSLFTVGVAEECDTMVDHVMAAAPRNTHQMAATITTATRHVSADRLESRHVSADRPEQRHVSADRPESRHVTDPVRERRGLRSSVADPPMTSVRAAGIPKHQPAASHSSPADGSLSSSSVATLSSSSVATLSSSSVATLSSSSVATLSSSPVAMDSCSPVATQSGSPVATHSSALDAMDKMAALPVPTGKMAAPAVLKVVGGVPATESAPETAPVGELSPHSRRRRRKKASSSPQDADVLQEAAVDLETTPEVSPTPPRLLALPAPPELLALPAPSKLLAHQPATSSVDFPNNFSWGGSIPRGGEFVGGVPARSLPLSAFVLSWPPMDCSPLWPLMDSDPPWSFTDSVSPWLPKPPDLPWLPEPPDLPWLPELSDLLWLSESPDLPWLPEPPDPPWIHGTPDPPWLSVAPDPPWLPVAPDPPWLPVAPDPPWLPWNLHWRPCSRRSSNAIRLRHEDAPSGRGRYVTITSVPVMFLSLSGLHSP